MKQKRFHVKAILVVLCSVGLFLTALYAFRSPLTLLLLDKVVIPFVEQRVEGLNAGIGGVEIARLSRLDLHDLSLKYHPPEQTGFDLTVPRVRIMFSPIDLLGGVDNFLQSLKLEAVAGECIVNLPPAPAEDQEPTTASVFSLPALPAVIPTIDLRNWRVVIRGEDEEWLLSDIDIHGGKQRSNPLLLTGRALYKQVILQLAATVEPNEVRFTLAAENDPVSIFRLGSEATFSFDPARPMAGTGKFHLEYSNGRLFDHPVDHLSLSGEVGGGELRLDNVRLDNKNELLYVQRLTLPPDLLLSGDIAGAISKGEGELSLSLNDPAAYIPYIPPEYHGVYLASRLEKFQLTGGLRGGNLEVDTARLRGADFDIQLTGGVLEPAGGNTARDAVKLHLPWRIEIRDMASVSNIMEQTASLSGTLSAQGTVSGTFAEPSTTYSLSATALSYNSLPIGDVAARGKGDSHGLTLEHLSVNHPVINAALDKAAKISVSGDTLQIEEPLRMVTDAGYVEWSGRLGKEDGDFALSGSFCGDRDFIRGICGIGESDFRAASFNLSVQGPWVAPTWKLNASLHELNYHDIKGLSAQVHLDYRDQNLAIRELTLTHKEQSLVEAGGFLPLETSSSRVSLLDGPLGLNGVMDIGNPQLFAFLYPELIKSSGPIHLDFALSGTTSHPLGGVNLSVEHFQLDPALSHLPDEPMSIKAEISGQENLIALKKLTVSSPTISGTANGMISGLSPAGIKDGRLFSDNSDVSLDGELRVADLSWLSGELAAIEKLRGTADLRFQVSGPLAAPAYSGEAAVKNGTLRIGTDLPAIRELNMKAKFSEQGVSFTQCSALMGGAPVECGGNIGLAPERAGELDLTLKGKDMLFYRGEGISFRGNGDLRLTGNMEALNISGAIGLTEGKVYTVIDFLSLFTSLFETGPRPEPRVFSIRTDPLRSGRLHIRLTSEQPVIVANNLLNARLQPNLLLTGTGELPYLVGELTLRQGRLLLPGGRLNIEEGRVIFDELNPDRPMVQITGQAKMKGYDISALIDGYYDEPTVSLSSTPYLADKDLLLLLLTGRKPQKSTGTAASETGWGDMAFFVSKNLYKSLVNGDEPEQEDLAERFTLDIGRETTKQGDNTIEARFFINDGFWLPNDQLFLVAEKDVWDDYHLGLRLVFRYF